MNLWREILQTLDAVLIFPYRLPGDPTAGWWLGTLTLAVWAALLGGATMSVVSRINRPYVENRRSEMLSAHQESWEALKSGDKSAWRGFNDQANDAFGRAFFLSLAMGCASLWPAFLALGWLRLRFQSVGVPLPFTDATLGYVGGFVVCYLAVRLGWAWLARVLRSASKKPGIGVG